MRTIHIYSLDIGTVSSYAAGEALVERGKLTSLPMQKMVLAFCDFGYVMQRCSPPRQEPSERVFRTLRLRGQGP